MAERTAVVTMVYNEKVFLPLWTRYYAGQFAPSSCYIIDHGTEDGSTADLGEVNVVRIPRSPKHNRKRAKFISDFCSSLLEWYDAVIYTDVDEFLVPDPMLHPSLSDYTKQLRPGATITTIGLNVTHVPDTEPALNLSSPILGQRRWARFVFPMCKPLITTVPISWSPGFHSSDQAVVFDGIYLFHLHNFDLPVSLQRLAITRAMPWGDGPPDHYQRWSDEKHEQVALAIARLPKITGNSFGPDDPMIKPRLDWVSRFVVENPSKKHLFYMESGIACNELLEIPERFFGNI